MNIQFATSQLSNLKIKDQLKALIIRNNRLNKAQIKTGKSHLFDGFSWEFPILSFHSQ
jgi:hypothetical protein